MTAEHKIQNDIRVALSRQHCTVFRVNVGNVKTADGRFFSAGVPLRHKFFACALTNRLKQEFTLDELNMIANKHEFKGVPWIQDLLRNTELVEDE